jgi:LysM repeat protein
MRCQIPEILHPSDMNPAAWLPLSAAFSLVLLSGCTNTQTAGTGPGTGPFDANGNYREEWADDPSKWRRPGSQEDVPVVAKNEEPPANATPLPPTPRPSTVTTTAKPQPVVVKVTPKPKPKPKPKPQVTRYTVKKGDTLSGIASRYGSSVAAIRRANGISGSLIRPGQRLVVPKR